MEREVGGGIGMGSTCNSMADSFQCMTKFTTKKENNKNLAFKHLESRGRGVRTQGKSQHQERTRAGLGGS